MAFIASSNKSTATLFIDAALVAGSLLNNHPSQQLYNKALFDNQWQLIPLMAE